ncbi:MAG: OmpA family protein [Rhodocyclaceae bacterium]|nr:OmpA family protein [Rhodocyclaceae bacterium]
MPRACRRATVACSAQHRRARCRCGELRDWLGGRIDPESAPVIAAIKAELSKRPAPEITVIGHTDRVGKLEGNDELSKRRAEAVRDILSGDGIKAASMEVAGRGEREPVVATADEVAEARNRRVEISIR